MSINCAKETRSNWVVFNSMAWCMKEVEECPEYRFICYGKRIRPHFKMPIHPCLSKRKLLICQVGCNFFFFRFNGKLVSIKAQAVRCFSLLFLVEMLFVCWVVESLIFSQMVLPVSMANEKWNTTLLRFLTKLSWCQCRFDGNLLWIHDKNLSWKLPLYHFIHQNTDTCAEICCRFIHICKWNAFSFIPNMYFFFTVMILMSIKCIACEIKRRKGRRKEARDRDREKCCVENIFSFIEWQIEMINHTIWLRARVITASWCIFCVDVFVLWYFKRHWIAIYRCIIEFHFIFIFFFFAKDSDNTTM